FHELDASGRLPNNLKLFVDDFHDDLNSPLELIVEYDELKGRCMVGAPNDPKCPWAGKELRGPQLLGAKLRLLDKSATIKTVHTLTIIGFDTTPFWSGTPNQSAPIYKFTYDASGPEGPQLPLCRQTSDPRDPLKGMALVFRGDRYVARDKTVTVTA